MYMEIKTEKQKNLIDMAKKRRHIHLVEKMATGKPSTPSLTKSELKELESFEIPNNSCTIVDSQDKVAKVFGVATRSVERWVKDGMPITPQGKYDLIEIRSWRLLKKRKKALKNKDKDYWEAKYREYKAKLAEIALKQKKGMLVSRKTVEKDLITISLALKRGFLGLAWHLPPQLLGKDLVGMEAVLKNRISEVISLFSAKQIFHNIIYESKIKFRDGTELIIKPLDEKENEESETD